MNTAYLLLLILVILIFLFMYFIGTVVWVKVVEKDEWPASYCTSSAKSEVSDHTSLSHLLSFPLLLRYYCDSTDLLLRLLFGS